MHAPKLRKKRRAQKISKNIFKMKGKMEYVTGFVTAVCYNDAKIDGAAPFVRRSASTFSTEFLQKSPLPRVPPALPVSAGRREVF